MRKILAALFVVLTYAILIFNTYVTLQGEEVVRLRLSTNVGFAPLTVRMTATVEPHEDNRMLCFAWDSPDGESGQTCKQLDGIDSPVTIARTVKLGQGEYQVAATVVRFHDGKPSYHSAKQPLNVQEPGTPYVR